MKTYYLFLDESLKSDTMKNLVFGGCIIEETVYRNTIVIGLKQLKNDVFNKTDVILHEYDVRKGKGVYAAMCVKAYREKFWTGLSELLSTEGLYTMASVIDMGLLSALYDNGHSTNEFAIALQEIMENYVHFLINQGGKGYIYIEERNAKESKMLEDLYYEIKSGGTSFIDEQAFRERLIGINFLLKSDDNAGLQLADFIPNSLNRHYSGLAQKTNNVFNAISKQQYDGGHSMPERFGIKKIL